MLREQNKEGTARRTPSTLDLLLASVLVGLCAAAIAGMSWTRPARAALSLTYEQSGQLSYSGQARPGSVYGRAGLRSGQPIYAGAVRTVELAYAYRLASAAPADLSGEEQLVVTVDDGQGISRAIPLQRRTPFAGDSFTAHGRLDVAELEIIARQFGEASSIPGGGSYTVHISPSVTVRGRLGGSAITTSFDKPVEFAINSTGLVPTSSTGPTPLAATNRSPGSAGQAAQQSNLLAVSSPGAIAVPSGQPAMLFGAISVGRARVASLAALFAAIVLACIAGRRIWKRATSEDEDVRIATRYGAFLVDTESLPSQPLAVVELSSFEGVLKVGRRLECPILRCNDYHHVYAVVDNGTLYRYTSPARVPRPAHAPAARAAEPKVTSPLPVSLNALHGSELDDWLA